MISIGDTTIKRSRYRNPVGELNKLHRLADAKRAHLRRRYGRLARYLAAPGDPGGTRTPYLQIGICALS